METNGTPLHSMVGLTVADLTVEAIREAETQLQEQAATVEQLRGDLARLHTKLADADAEQSRLAAALWWRRLMAEVEADAEVAEVTASFTASIAEFRRSLQPPPGYDESIEGIPYIDTDDYGDFSPLDLCVDGCLEKILHLVQTNRTELSAHKRRSGQSQQQQQFEKEKNGEEQWAVHRRRAMLMLLVLSVNLGRLEDGLAGVVLEEGEFARETDELRENVAEVWNQLLYTDTGLTEAEREEWKDVVHTFLGAPYDASA